MAIAVYIKMDNGDDALHSFNDSESPAYIVMDTSKDCRVVDNGAVRQLDVVGCSNTEPADVTRVYAAVSQYFEEQGAVN